ncbi:M48 family metalloprotease [Oxalicibacterium solurbis]|uniref:PDZ domain-containing protein n=1 Tax=Oxalicibacterium solurbis TaxID=69280 RepID=A0A8J3F4Y1_9BURK|nr:M48 family metalloprotease [Oxalicibacterium solurbis]GGI53494.1 hypothetical protein GCM10011430_06680 [Oxalicibacterium solurbis]
MQDLLRPFLSSLKHVPVRIGLLSAAAMLAGCSTVPLDAPGGTYAGSGESAQVQALRTITTQQDRLYRVAAPLLVNNTPLCKGNVRNLIGFSAKNKYSYSEDYVAAASALGYEERLQVTGVLNNSGAARAGVRRGDLLTSVQDQPMPQGPNAERQAAAVLGPLVGRLSSVKLGLQRDGNPLTANVPLTQACGFGIELGNVDNVNAYSDGRRVLITRGMLNFARNDTELAYVMAKELAHTALGHPTRQQMNATIGGIIDNMIRVTPDTAPLSGTAGVKAMPQELDEAADTLSLYMLARAGYSIDGAAAFWQRLASQYPASVLNGYTAIHPDTDARLAAIRKATNEIKAKQSAKKTLMP